MTHSQVVYDYNAIKKIKDYSEMVFILPSKDEAINATFKEAVNEYYKLDIKSSFMGKKEAYKYWRKSKRTVLLAEIKRDFDMERMLTETEFDLIGKKRIMKLYLKDAALGMDKSDFLYCVNLMQYIINNVSKLKNSNILKDTPKLNGNRLKSKTLLVREAQIKNIDSFGEIYPYPYKVVDLATYNELVLSQNKDYLYLYQAHKAGDVSAVLYTEWRIVDASDGALISGCSSGTAHQLGKKEMGLLLKKIN